ncbi:MAG: chemotaxis protein CheW [Planctomycetota bacterium]
MQEPDEIVREFLVESFEGLDQLDEQLVALESHPDDIEVLSSIFRTIHSMKGASGFLEFKRLERVAHAGENLLDALRGQRLAMNAVIATALLEMNDALRRTLRDIEARGADEGDDMSSLVAKLEALLTGESAPPSAAAPAPEAAPAPAAAPTAAASPEAAAPVTAPAAAPAAPRPSRDGAPSVADSSIRIRVDQLDQLMNLAGELVLARNQILQHTARFEDTATNASAQRLSLITSELQEGIMKIRMQPVGLLWNKLPRVVRDLSVQLGKEVELEMRGADTELDKTLLEAIKDPLTHIVRNSLDHGVEAPADRLAQNKPRVGTLSLIAYHESGQVNLEIRDDGRGIDPAVIRARAVEKGHITSEQAARLDDRAALDLLFLPGFSTAKAITNVSGRGVGMDVVRRNLERVGGTVELRSVAGQGTTVHVRIPLTLAIIPALTVQAGGQRYAIPQASLVELVRIEADDVARIERVQGHLVYRLRGKLLPLVDLAEQLLVAPERIDDACSLVVVHAGGARFGLVVDQIGETEEIVVKPLGRQVKHLPVYAGTTILGDGRVALILDVGGLGQRARILGAHSSGDSAPREEREEPVTDGTGHLVFLAGGRRLAVELATVDRLEELDPTLVERAGTARVIQYRGGILPLIDVGDALGEGPICVPEGASMRVIVRTDACGSLGLVVNEVIDIVQFAECDSNLASRSGAGRGTTGVVVADGRVTELLDVPWLLRDQGAECSRTEGATTSREVAHERAIQLCTFRLAGTLFGINVLDVQEVLRPQAKTPIPLAPGVIEGLINLRGETVTLLDLGRRLGQGRAPAAPAPSAVTEGGEDLSMNVVLRTSDGVISVLVDEVGEVLELSSSAFEPVPDFVDETTRRVARGIYKLEHELLLQLDVNAVASIATTTAGASPAPGVHTADEAFDVRVA